MANIHKHLSSLVSTCQHLLYPGLYFHQNTHTHTHRTKQSIPMAAFSSSSYISNLERIHHESHHALRLRLPSRLAIDSSRRRRSPTGSGVKAAANLAPNWDAWKPEQGSKAPSLSDIVWPSAGAFAAMAMLGKMDQVLARKGVSMTIAPLGAVCAVLFATPSAPGARKYNMFMAQMGCAAIGVLAFSVLGPGWLARSTALSASLAFMIYFRAIHPPAASLPLLFIDGAKLHHLKYWYILFPGAAGCLLLCLIQEVVCYLKDNVKF